MGWLAELGRRSVLRVGAAYLALAWLLLQVTATVAPIFDLPAWTQKLAIWLLALGLVPALLLAWLFEWTPQGPVRDRGRRRAASANEPDEEPARLRRIHRIDLAIIGVLSVLLAWFWLRSSEVPAPAVAERPAPVV